MNQQSAFEFSYTYHRRQLARGSPRHGRRWLAKAGLREHRGAEYLCRVVDFGAPERRCTHTAVRAPRPREIRVVRLDIRSMLSIRGGCN